MAPQTPQRRHAPAQPGRSSTRRMIWPMSTPFPRDLVGYGGNPPHPHWPGEARIAVNWVINYEEGSEYNVHDDGFSEATLTESGGISDVKGRDLAA